MRLSRYADAEPMLLESYKLLSEGAGARPVHIETVRRYLVELYEALDQPADAQRFAATPGA